MTFLRKFISWSNKLSISILQSILYCIYHPTIGLWLKKKKSQLLYYMISKSQFVNE